MEMREKKDEIGTIKYNDTKHQWVVHKELGKVEEREIPLVPGLRLWLQIGADKWIRGQVIHAIESLSFARAVYLKPNDRPVAEYGPEGRLERPAVRMYELEEGLRVRFLSQQEDEALQRQYEEAIKILDDLSFGP